MKAINLPIRQSIKKEANSWFGVFVGSILVAAAYVLFFTPYKIIPGGVYGLAIVVNHYFPDLMVGTIGLCLDVPLLITSFIVFGKGSGAKTVFSALILPVIMNSMTMLVGGTDPATMLGGKMDLSGDLLLCCIFGGILVGVGLGLIVKSKATSGGTDIIGMIITKYMRIPFSKSMIFVESCVVLTGLIVFGEWTLPLYSLVAIFVTSKLIDLIVEGVSTDKMLFIISEKHEEIRNFIINDLGRGGTLLKASGMYTKAEKSVIFVVVSRNELPLIKEMIKGVDPAAFITISNSHEIVGDGFKPLTD